LSNIIASISLGVFTVSVDEVMSFFGFLHCTVVKCSDVAEERTASTFGVIKYVQVNAKVISNKECVGYVCRFHGVWPITVTERWDARIGLFRVGSGKAQKRGTSRKS
jgi:hypothetical protein